jgi:hypothetical protein
MATFDDFLDELKKEIADYAQGSWKDFKDAAVSDGNGFVQGLKEDLEVWTRELARGAISQEDFEWLVEGKKDLAELEALKRAGLAEARWEDFINGLTDVVVNTAVKVFLV